MNHYRSFIISGMKSDTDLKNEQCEESRLQTKFLERRSILDQWSVRKVFAVAIVVTAMIAAAGGFYACNKFDTNHDGKLMGSISRTSDNPWEDCNATVHPYSLNNIRTAKAELDINGIDIDPNKIFKYVCFLVNNDNERDQLNVLIQQLNFNLGVSDSIKIYNLPLADPSLYTSILFDTCYNGRDTIQNMQYAIIPADLPTPVGNQFPVAQCIFLDSLYFPDEATEEELDLGAHILAGTIQVDSLEVEEWYDGQRGLISWLKKAVTFVKNTIVGTYPSGYVKMNNDPMWGTTVDVIAWGLPFRSTTNANGYFYINKSIHVGTVVYLSFNNSNCNINLWNLEHIVNINNITLTARYFIGGKTAANLGGMNINLDNTSLGGMCATIADGVERYRQKAQQIGIGVPTKVSITAIWGKDFSNLGNGSAPMINYLLLNTNANFVNRYVTNFLMPSLKVVQNLMTPFSRLLPDIIIPAKKGFDKDDILATTLHEYTHAAHAHLAGKIFWTNVLTGEINNMINNNGEPYGYKATSAPEVGVAEAWAYDVEYYMMYLLTNELAYIDNMENRYISPNYKDSLKLWLPRGLYFDLWDVNGTFKYPGTNGKIITDEPQYRIIDEVYGITWNSMYLNLFGTNDFLTYKNKIRQAYPTKVSMINTLFNCYSY